MAKREPTTPPLGGPILQAGFARGTKAFDTLSDLKAQNMAPVKKDDLAVILGYDRLDDGRTMYFRYDPYSSETPDDINYVDPDNGSGQWVRMRNTTQVANEDFISHTIGVKPSSAGAVVGTIGAYFETSDLFQKLRWDGDSWQPIGNPFLTAGSVEVPCERFLKGSLTAGIEEAHEWAMDRGFERFTLITPPGKHEVHRGVEITGNCHVKAYNTIFQWPSNQSKYTLAADASANDTSVELVNASGLKVGWEMNFLDDSIIPDLNKGAGNSAVISSINGNTVTFESTIGVDLQTAENAYIIHTFAFIKFIGTDISDLSSTRPYRTDGVLYGGIEGAVVDGRGANYEGPTYEEWEENPDWINSFCTTPGPHEIDGMLFKDIIAYDFPGEVLGTHGPNFLVDHCMFFNCGDPIHSGQNSGEIRNSYFEDCYFGFHSSKTLWNIKIHNNSFIRCGIPIDGLGDDDSAEFGTASGTDDRYFIHHNYFEDTKQAVVTITVAAQKAIFFEDNFILNANTDNLSTYDYTVLTVNDARYISFKNNWVIDDQATSTSFSKKFGALKLNGIQDRTGCVKDNYFYNLNGDVASDIAAYVFNGSDIPVTGNTFIGDYLYMISADANLNINDNIAQELTATGGTTFVRVRGGYTKGQIHGNDVDVTTPIYFEPSGVDFVNNPPDISIRGNKGLYVHNATDTLATGASPALRELIGNTDNAGSNIREDKSAFFIPSNIENLTTVSAPCSYRWHFEWDPTAGSDGQWFMVFEWESDPGINVDIDIRLDKG